MTSEVRVSRRLKFATGALVFLGQFQERLHDERVVLGGDGELLRRLAAAAGVALLHEISLLHHLARVTQ